MAKKKLTKKDPQAEISGWLDFKSKPAKKEQPKVSASLKQLNHERRKSLLGRLGVLIFISLCLLVGCGYYISPKASICSVRVKGAAQLPRAQVVKASGLTAKDKVVGVMFHRQEINQRLVSHFPELSATRINFYDGNRVNLTLKQKKVIGYVRTGNRCHMIMSNGKVGLQALPLSMIEKDKPLFVGYNKKTSLKEDLEVFSSLPTSIRDRIKMMSGETERPTQIIFVMKDNNVVIGNIRTIKDKMKYYDEIKTSLKGESVVDFEIGAYSRSLTQSEKVKYGISQ
ncbi:MAG: cell division protein FtsQ/DivIB [Lactobacillus sp.]|jgi:cell division protein FtsQ|nr:cell division protein FtsQ/DivIB [Lactobacillus sp.]MCI1466241.1 cell division protein FtsQ/DivIB [Lactobacillus sp.]MCI1481371.1 cell division protein FtsQ/DivIB [Lactobacillus sp.]